LLALPHARDVDIERARYLVSPAGRAALAAVPLDAGRDDPNRLVTGLRKSHLPAEASALAEQATLRSKAIQRFGHDPSMLLTAPGLEMMTHPLVAQRRARRLAALGLLVADLTCGLGGDLRACAEVGMQTTGIERAPATAILARANVPSAEIVIGDAARPPLHLGSLAVILDPSRRDASRRTFDPASFSPPWDTCLELLSAARAGVLKAPPGLDRERVPASAEMEAVQLGTGMREVTIWTGHGAAPGLRRAVLLPAGAELTSEAPECPEERGPIGRYVFDPESCVTRAGLVRHLAHRLGAWMLDNQVAYLSTDTPAFDPLAATFEVLEVVPFSVRRLKELLAARGWRADEVRRRAFPVEPEELQRLLGRAKGEPVTILCTTIAGSRTVVVARRLRPEIPVHGA
jgi:hypothetical protein